MKFLRLILVLAAFASGVNGQEISPWLFGQNHWMDTRDEGERPGYLSMLWPKVGQSGIRMVRIGGNGYEHRFPDNHTLIGMIDSIRGIGAEPILQVPRKFSAEEVTGLVNLLNHNPEREPVQFWSIGNEPICNNKGKIDEVYTYLIRLAPAMKAADPTIKIFVFDACTLYKEAYEALCGGRLDITGKDEKGNWIIDGFTFHNYPNGRDFDRDDVVFSGPFSIRRQVIQLTEMMEEANRKHGRTGDAELLWGLTEVNVTYINPDREISGIGNPSFLGGQFIAEMYGIGLEYGAFTVNPWCLSETDRVRTDFGFLGLPSEFYPRSSFYHTQMMASHMKGNFLPSATSNSYVRSIATASDDEIVVMILNRDREKDFEFDLILNKDGMSPKPLIIHADAGLDKMISGTIPGQTTLMFVLSETGEILKQYTYGLIHNLKNLPPDIQ
jgi:hypothetical protein